MEKNKIELAYAKDHQLKLVSSACDAKLWKGSYVQEEMKPGVEGVTRIIATRKKGPKAPPYVKQSMLMAANKDLVEALGNTIAYCEIRVLRNQADLEKYLGEELIGKLEILQTAIEEKTPAVFFSGCGWRHEKKTFHALVKFALPRTRNCIFITETTAMTSGAIQSPHFEDKRNARGELIAMDVLSPDSVWHCYTNLNTRKGIRKISLNTENVQAVFIDE